jgi:hypothetical protein
MRGHDYVLVTYWALSAVQRVAQPARRDSECVRERERETETETERQRDREKHAAAGGGR